MALDLISVRGYLVKSECKNSAIFKKCTMHLPSLYKQCLAEIVE